MKNFVLFALMAIVTAACGNKADKSNKSDEEEALALKEKIHQISSINQEAGQEFIDKSTEIVLELNSDIDYKIDFERVQNLKDTALKKLHKSIDKIEKVEGVDENIGYRDKFAELLKAELEAYKTLEEWYDVLQQTRERERVEKIRKKVLKKLKIMKQHQEKFKKAERKFINKYDL